jgi:hypothetical protein
MIAQDEGSLDLVDRHERWNKKLMCFPQYAMMTATIENAWIFSRLYPSTVLYGYS